MENSSKLYTYIRNGVQYVTPSIEFAYSRNESSEPIVEISRLVTN